MSELKDNDAEEKKNTPSFFNLKDYKKKYEGQDIYVVGSGKSCDFIDPSFLENKISIGINQVYQRFRCTYLLKKEIISKTDPIFEQAKYSTLFFSQNSHGGKGGKGNIIKEKIDKFQLPKEVTDNIVIYPHFPNLHSKDTEEQVLEKLKTEEDKLFTSFSSITTGIHLAYYMGAKNIILIGHDCCTINGENNMSGYHTDASMKCWGKNDAAGKKKYKNWLNEIRKTTRFMQTSLRTLGTNLVSINPTITLSDVVNGGTSEFKIR